MTFPYSNSSHKAVLKKLTADHLARRVTYEEYRKHGYNLPSREFPSLPAPKPKSPTKDPPQKLHPLPEESTPSTLSETGAAITAVIATTTPTPSKKGKEKKGWSRASLEGFLLEGKTADEEDVGLKDRQRNDRNSARKWWEEPEAG